MAGIVLFITGRSRTSRENCSIQITASVSLSILHFGEEKVRERGIRWLSMVSLYLCLFQGILSKIAYKILKSINVLKEGFNFKLIYICLYINIRC